MKYFLLILIILSAGCRQNPSSAPTLSPIEEERKGVPVINVEKVVGDSKHEFYLSDITQRIEYIPLEFTPECPVKTDASFFSIHVSSRDIFVLSKDVFHFDGNGKFLNRIGRKGNGPGEYTIPLRLAVDTIARRVYVLSNNARLVVFDFNGKHIRTILGEKIRNIDRGFHFIEQTKELACTGDGSNFKRPGNFFFKVLDTLANTRFVKKALLSGMLQQGERTWWDLKSIQDTDGILALDNFSDTIFCYRQSVFEPYLILDYGRYKITLDALMSSNYGEETGRYFRTALPASTSRYLFLRFMYGNIHAPLPERKYYYVRYDKLTRECISQKRDGVEHVFFANDLDGGMPFKDVAMNNQNQWVVAFDAYDMKEKLTPEYLSAAKAKDPQAKERLKQLVGRLTKNDNPVLMKIILK